MLSMKGLERTGKAPEWGSGFSQGRVSRRWMPGRQIQRSDTTLRGGGLGPLLILHDSCLLTLVHKVYEQAKVERSDAQRVTLHAAAINR